MRRRIGRPGLIGTMARTAVIAGTATAVVGGVQSAQQSSAQQKQQAQQFQAQQAQEAAFEQAQAAAAQAAPAPQPIAPVQDDTIAQLTKLGELKSAGLVDDAEFAAAKARLLGL